MKRPVLDAKCNENAVSDQHYFAEATRAVKELLADQLIYQKGKSATIEKPVTQVLRTGIREVIKSGSLIQDYEFASTSYQNLASAIFDRQLSPQVDPHPEILASFTNMCDRFWKWFA